MISTQLSCQPSFRELVLQSIPRSSSEEPHRALRPPILSIRARLSQAIRPAQLEKRGALRFHPNLEKLHVWSSIGTCNHLGGPGRNHGAAVSHRRARPNRARSARTRLIVPSRRGKLYGNTLRTKLGLRVTGIVALSCGG